MLFGSIASVLSEERVSGAGGGRLTIARRLGCAVGRIVVQRCSTCGKQDKAIPSDIQAVAKL